MTVVALEAPAYRGAGDRCDHRSRNAATTLSRAKPRLAMVSAAASARTTASVIPPIGAMEIAGKSAGGSKTPARIWRGATPSRPMAREFARELHRSGRRGDHGRIPRGTTFTRVETTDGGGDREAIAEIPLSSDAPTREWARTDRTAGDYAITDAEAIWHRVVRATYGRRILLVTACSREVGPYWEGVIAMDPPGRECAVCGDRHWAEWLERGEPYREGPGGILESAIDRPEPPRTGRGLQAVSSDDDRQ
jgi:hypothetical protein